jgi:hypothetical protein
VALIVFSTVYAVAASLNVTTSALGAGSADVASCDTNGVTTSFETAFSAAALGYEVTTVHVAGIATPSCDGQTLSLTLIGPGDASLAEASMTIGTPAANPSNLDFSGDDVAAALVLKVAVVIS